MGLFTTEYEGYLNMLISNCLVYDMDLYVDIFCLLCAHKLLVWSYTKFYK